MSLLCTRKSLIFLCSIFLLSCGGTDPIPQFTTNAISFVDETAVASLDFNHSTGAQGAFLFPEIMGAGIAVIDFDDDGWLDLYAIQSGSLKTLNASRDDALFRNVGGSPARFERVAHIGGIKPKGYGQGVAVADVNADGYPDLLLTSYGKDQLWLNDGNGGFTARDLPEDDEPWSSSALFFDFDNDGDQDIFLTHYVHYTPSANKACFFRTGALNYCAPTSYRATGDSLFRNNGEGYFEDVTKSFGLDKKIGNGLAAAAVDLNQDGWLDIYVANDQMANFVWLNQSGEGFVEQSFELGLALNMNGETEASMGIAIADFTSDGELDIFLTHLAKQTNTLYVRNIAGWYEDRTASMNLGVASVPYTGFGTVALDANMDGFDDLFVANGSVHLENEEDLRSGSFPFGEKNQLFINSGGSGFSLADFSRNMGQYVSRGVAVADLDNDGDPDLVISNAEGPLQYFDNRNKAERPWLGIVVENSNGSRLAHCQLTVRSRGWEKTFYNSRDGSYLSSSDYRFLLALPSTAGKDFTADVTCPGGWSGSKEKLLLNQYQTISLQSPGLSGV